MARHRDPTGVSNTCPTIDKIIDAANEVLDYAERPGYIITCYDFEMLKGIIGDIDSHAEEVRSMNTELRDFGHEQFKRAEHFEPLADERADKIAELEEQVARLEHDLKDANYTIEELEQANDEYKMEAQNAA